MPISAEILFFLPQFAIILGGFKPPCPVPPPRSPANVCGRASATSPVASRGFGDFAPKLWPGIRGKWEVPWENGGLTSFFLNGGLMSFFFFKWWFDGI